MSWPKRTTGRGCPRCAPSGYKEPGPCTCLVDCGAEACTGEPRDGITPGTFYRQGVVNNPQGLGGRTGKRPDTSVPKYDGPRGKSGKRHDGRRWGRGRPA